LFSDTKKFQEHILNCHISKMGGATELRKIDTESNGQYFATKLKKKMDIPIWLTCPFGDCAIKIKGPKCMIDHFLRKHSQAITLILDKDKHTTIDEINDQSGLRWPLGFKTDFIIHRENCLKNNQNRGLYLCCCYNGISTKEFHLGRFPQSANTPLETMSPTEYVSSITDQIEPEEPKHTSKKNVAQLDYLDEHITFQKHIFIDDL